MSITRPEFRAGSPCNATNAHGVALCAAPRSPARHPPGHAALGRAHRIARTGAESCARAASTGPATHLDHVQLGDAVLLHGHRQGDPVLLHEHLGVQAFPSMGNCALGLLGKAPYTTMTKFTEDP